MTDRDAAIPPQPVLREPRGISDRFSTTQTLDNHSVPFVARDGDAPIGENGAGKVTPGNVTRGLLKHDSGTVDSRTRARVVKNKVAPPFRDAEFDIMYTAGISVAGDTEADVEDDA